MDLMLAKLVTRPILFCAWNAKRVKNKQRNRQKVVVKSETGLFRNSLHVISDSDVFFIRSQRFWRTPRRPAIHRVAKKPDFSRYSRNSTPNCRILNHQNSNAVAAGLLHQMFVTISQQQVPDLGVP